MVSGKLITVHEVQLVYKCLQDMLQDSVVVLWGGLRGRCSAFCHIATVVPVFVFWRRGGDGGVAFALAERVR